MQSLVFSAASLSRIHSFFFLISAFLNDSMLSVSVALFLGVDLCLNLSFASRASLDRVVSAGHQYGFEWMDTVF